MAHPSRLSLISWYRSKKMRGREKTGTGHKSVNVPRSVILMESRSLYWIWNLCMFSAAFEWLRRYRQQRAMIGIMRKGLFVRANVKRSGTGECTCNCITLKREQRTRYPKYYSPIFINHPENNHWIISFINIPHGWKSILIGVLENC